MTHMIRIVPPRALLLPLLFAALPLIPAVAQTLETETARLLVRKAVKFGANFEYQRSADGRERALPMFFEYGVTSTTELVIEPVFYTSIRPKVGSGATGAGDLEITLVQQLFGETASRPAFAIAGEVKVPTARNVLIGTGRTDFAGYLIASKRFGRLDTHVNLGYTVVGKPVGAPLRNIANFAVAGMYDLGRRAKLYGEVLANTAATIGAAETSTTPEAAGGEIVGTLGVGHYVSQRAFVTFGLSYDNSGAVLFRPGVTFRIP